LTTDFRELNKRLIRNRHPLPRIHDKLDQAGQSGRWTTGDIEDAFFTVLLNINSRELTGFSTHEHHYEYTCMPQGVAPAAEAWAEVIGETLSDLLTEKMFFYQDDVFNHEEDLRGHIILNEHIFEKLRKRGMIFKPSKYHANYRMMKVLGHVMTEDGRYPDPELVRAINDLGVPTDQSQVRSLVGLAIVAKEYIRGMSTMISPLQDLLKKGVNVIEE
jgi:hypothetical protein